jgi:hypothetical protein
MISRALRYSMVDVTNETCGALGQADFHARLLKVRDL